MATRTITASGGTRAWHDVLTWVEGAVPTSADDVVGTAASGNITLNANGACRSLDLTDYTALVSHSSSVVITVGDALGGKFIFSSAMGYNRSGTAARFHFASTSNNGGAGWPIALGGKQLAFPTFIIAAVGGHWVLQDGLTAVGDIVLSGGTLDTNGKPVQCVEFTSTGTAARAVILGSSTVTLTGTAAVWNVTGSNVTVSAAAATIVITNTSTTNRTFNGFSATYGTLDATYNSAGTLIVGGSNTFGTFKFSGSVAKSVRFQHATTTTVTNWIVNGTAGNLITIFSSTAGSSTTVLNKAGGGTAVSEYVHLTDITATPADTWYASTGSVDNGNNTGWTFGAPPGEPVDTGVGQRVFRMRRVPMGVR